MNAPKPSRPAASDPAVAGDLLHNALRAQVSTDAFAWLSAAIADLREGRGDRRLPVTLAMARRKIGRADLVLPADALATAQRACSGWQPQLLGVDEAARVLLLLASHGNDDAAFAATVARLCATAGVEEHIAYLKGFAIFPAAAQLVPVAREAVRSSTSAIFEAIACNNPYPFSCFDRDAWNQMVVKCVFAGSAIESIYGLHERRNAELMAMLGDLVTERRLAGRPLPDAVLQFLAGDTGAA